MKVWRVYWEAYEADYYGKMERVADKARYFSKKEDAENFREESKYIEKEAHVYYKGLKNYCTSSVYFLERYENNPRIEKIEIVEIVRYGKEIEEIEVE